MVTGLTKELDRASTIYLTADKWYRNNWIIRRIIDYKSHKMVKGWGEPVFSEPFNRDEELEPYLEELKDKYCQAQKEAWINGDAYIIRFVDDGRRWDEPIDRENIKSIRYSQIYDRHEVRPDIKGNEYDIYRPEYYQATITDSGIDDSNLTSLIIHRDRIIRFSGEFLSKRAFIANNYCFASIVDSLFNAIGDYNTVKETIKDKLKDFEILLRGIENYDFQDTKVNEESKTIVTKKDGTKIITYDKDLETYEYLTRSFSQVGELFTDVFKKDLIGASGLSQIQLFNEHPNGMNSTGESQLRQDAEQIIDLQKLKWGKNIYFDVNLLTDYLGYERSCNWQWINTYQSTPKEEAGIKKTNADTDKIYLDTGVLFPEEVAESRFGGNNYSDEITLMEGKERGIEQKQIEPTEEEETQSEESKTDALPVSKFIPDDGEVLPESFYAPIDIESLIEVEDDEG